VSDLSRIRAIFFDLDGVLVDSSIAIPRAINFALDSQGVAPWPEERLHLFIGSPLLQAFREILESEGADPGLAEACIGSYRERYRQSSLEETILMPGIEAALRRLAGSYTLAVVTAKPEAYARPILDKLGVVDCFRQVAGPPLDPGHPEAKAETLARAMEVLGIEARSTTDPAPAAMVGDRHFDVAAGRAQGLATVGVSWGIGSVAELRRAGADHVVSSPAELAELFLERGERGPERGRC
jgi:phosphoglycolate phosphatase